MRREERQYRESSRARQRNEDRLDAHGFESGDVVAVERLEEQDLVAGIEQGHGCGVKTAGSAAGDQDFGLGVVVEAVVASLLRAMALRRRVMPSRRV